MEKSTLKNMKVGREKLKNIWFFYKKQIIAGLVLLAVGAFLLIQCVARKSTDLLIYWAGPVYFSSDAEKKVDEAFEAIIPEKYAQSVGLVVTVIGDDPTVGMTDAEKQQYAYDYIGEKETLVDFKTRMRLPDTVICLLSPTCFEEAKNDGSLRPLSEVLTALPAAATEDGYGLRFGELPFYRSNSILKNFPADSILCIKSSSIFRTSDDYDRQIEAFKAIVAFSFEE